MDWNEKQVKLLYKALIYLYPRWFREEFGLEMQVTFSDALDNVAHRGIFSQFKVLVREIIDIPVEVFRQHLSIETSTILWTGPASRGELLISLLFFILPTAYLILSSIPDTSAALIWFAIGIIIGAFIVTGFLKGFPRWSLPYFGMALALLSFLFVFQWLADQVTAPILVKFGTITRDESTRLLLKAFWTGLLWLSLLVFIFSVLGILALIRRFESLLDSIRKDWTLASYLIYYAATFTLFLAYDQFRGNQPFVLASAICLASGGWFYLHARNSWQRILALLSGLSLAMLAAIAARWSFIPGNKPISWPLELILDPRNWSSAIWSIFDWGWIILILIAPVILRLFENSHRRALCN